MEDPATDQCDDGLERSMNKTLQLSPAHYWIRLALEKIQPESNAPHWRQSSEPQRTCR